MGKQWLLVRKNSVKRKVKARSKGIFSAAFHGLFFPKNELLDKILDTGSFSRG